MIVVMNIFVANERCVEALSSSPFGILPFRALQLR